MMLRQKTTLCNIKNFIMLLSLDNFMTPNCFMILHFIQNIFNSQRNMKYNDRSVQSTEILWSDKCVEIWKFRGSQAFCNDKSNRKLHFQRYFDILAKEILPKTWIFFHFWPRMKQEREISKISILNVSVILPLHSYP